ncbi:hypothetical protein EDD16DRAFT_1678539 [Pisolithus croceorrhizus]|nr:hypothetical protein EDD16DRAFT_1678539 [Pisolithus croceorrhizus]
MQAGKRKSRTRTSFVIVVVWISRGHIEIPTTMSQTLGGNIVQNSSCHYTLGRYTGYRCRSYIALGSITTLF